MITRDSPPVQDELGVARTSVEAAIAKLGVSPSACSMHMKHPGAAEDPHAAHAAGPPSGDPPRPRPTSWTLKRGSAAILISLVVRMDGIVLRVVSPVLVPAADTKVDLYKHVLELNAAGLGDCAFGVIGDRLVLVSERPAHDATVPEIEQMIRHVGHIADVYDDKLAAQFGGKRSSDQS